MIANNFATRTDVVLVNRTIGTPDADGNETYTTVETAIVGCSVQPRGTSEDISGRDQVHSEETLICPLGTTVGPEDRVKIGGVEHYVLGRPREWRGFGGGHLSVPLKRTTG